MENFPAHRILVSVRTDDLDTNAFLSTSLVLVTLLTTFVPFITLLGNVSLIVTVAGAGIVYMIFLFSTGTILEGIGSAVFVLAVFNANVPILSVSGGSQFNLLLVDIVAILAFVMFVARRYPDKSLEISPIEKLAFSAFGCFVAWSFISAIVGHGPSQLSGFVFALTQTRYLFLFVTSMLIIRESCIECGIYPLLISIFGNLLFSLVEIINGGAFGLTYLGEGYGRVFSQFMIGPIILNAGMYAGGFADNSRVLTAMILIALPIALSTFNYRSWSNVLFSMVLVVAASILIRVSETDAGWMALLVTSSIMLAYVVYYGIRNAVCERHGWTTTNAIVAITFTTFLYLKRSVKSAPSSDTTIGAGTGGSSSSGTGTASNSPSAADFSIRLADGVIELFSYIPFISSNTLPVRLDQYIAAIKIGLQYPLFGIGGLNFVLVSESFGLPKGMAIHNTILAYLAATGFVGVLGYLISVTALLYVSFNRSISLKYDDSLLWAGITTSMLGFHAFSFWVTAHDWVQAQTVFWLIGGIILGANKRRS